MRIAFVAATALLFTSCQQPAAKTEAAQAQGEAQAAIFHSNPQFAAKGYPFSEAVEVDGLVFLSGQIGTLPETAELIEGGIDPQSRQTMENIGAALERLGLSFGDVVKCTVMIDDMDDWPTFNAIYKGYFEGRFPARSAFGADGLALGAAVEVECIAKR